MGRDLRALWDLGALRRMVMPPTFGIRLTARASACPVASKPLLVLFHHLTHSALGAPLESDLPALAGLGSFCDPIRPCALPSHTLVRLGCCVPVLPHSVACVPCSVLHSQCPAEQPGTRWVARSSRNALCYLPTTVYPGSRHRQQSLLQRTTQLWAACHVEALRPSPGICKRICVACGQGLGPRGVRGGQVRSSANHVSSARAWC